MICFASSFASAAETRRGIDSDDTCEEVEDEDEDEEDEVKVAEEDETQDDTVDERIEEDVAGGEVIAAVDVFETC